MVASGSVSALSSTGRARDAVVERLATDPAAQHFGIELKAVNDHEVAIALDAQSWMVNGHGILHGAVLFWLGDTAFAYLAESKGVPSVSRQADIAFIAPVPAGSRLTARAREKVRFGRNSIVDVDLTDDGGALVGRMTVHGAALRQP